MTKTYLLDTDFCGDCDDVAALALLCGAAADNPGAVRLAGVAVNVGCPPTAAAVRTVLDFYGLGDTPVGIAETPDPHGCASRYLDALAALSTEVHANPRPRRSAVLPGVVDERARLCPGRNHGGFARTSAVKAPASVSARALYRQLLSEADDGSLTVVSIGYFNNLDAALHDDPALFHRKVRAVYLMAGGFGPRQNHLECNVMGHLECTRRFVRDYRGQAIYIGFECGVSVKTDLTGFPAGTDHFLLRAFELRSDDHMRHPSWDPITVDLALNGENDCYRLSNPGFVEIDEEGRTLFSENPQGNARHLIFAASDADVSARITREVRKAARLEQGMAGFSMEVLAKPRPRRSAALPNALNGRARLRPGRNHGGSARTSQETVQQP